MDIKEFAARWGVDRKTIRRDLRAFAESGQTARPKKDNAWDGRSRQWRYDSHVTYLFVCNFGEAALKARRDKLLAAKLKLRRIPR